MDIDGVIADNILDPLRLFNKKFGFDLSKNDIISFEFEYEEKNFGKFYEKYLKKTRHALDIKLIKGAKKGIKKLSEEYIINITTARAPKNYEVTRKWLRKNKIQFNNLIFADDKSSISGDILIDDYDKNIVDFLKKEPKRFGILFSQPWSLNNNGLKKYCDLDQACAAKNWDEILSLLM